MFGAPNVGNLSRVWSVIVGLALQTCANYCEFKCLASSKVAV